MPTILDLDKTDTTPEKNVTLLEELFPELQKEVEHIKQNHSKEREELETHIIRELPKLISLAEKLPQVEKEQEEEYQRRILETFLRKVSPQRPVEVRAGLIPAINEGTTEDPMYVLAADVTSDVAVFLLLSGVDLEKIDIQVFKDFVREEKEVLQNVLSGGYIKIIEDRNKLRTEVKTLVEKPLVIAIQEIEQKILLQKEDFERLKNLLELKKGIGEVTEENEVIMVQQLYSLIDKHKNERQGQSYVMLQQFYMNNERLLWDALMCGQAYRQETQEHSSDMETFMKRLWHLDNKEIQYRRTINENKVRVLMREDARDKNPLTISRLKQMHRTMNAGVLPFFALGMRSDGFGTNTEFEWGSRTVVIVDKFKNQTETTPKSQVESEMQKLVDKANDFTYGNKPKILFELGIAQLTARYAQIHPHTDGNGTMAVLFAEMCFMKQGYEEITGRVGKTKLMDRLKETFRNNKLAIINVLGGYALGEMLRPKNKPMTT